MFSNPFNKNESNFKIQESSGVSHANQIIARAIVRLDARAAW